VSCCGLVCLVPQILALMVDLEDEPDWSVADEIEEDDNDRCYRLVFVTRFLI